MSRMIHKEDASFNLTLVEAKRELLIGLKSTNVDGDIIIAINSGLPWIYTSSNLEAIGKEGLLLEKGVETNNGDTKSSPGSGCGDRS